MTDFDFDASDILPDSGKPERLRKHPVAKSSRVFGIVMVIVALCMFIYGLQGWNIEIARMISLGDYMDPTHAFINPENLTGNITMGIFFMGLASIMIILGTYRIIYSRKSSWLIFPAFFLVFGIGIGMALHVNNIRMEVKEKTLTNEKVWAEKRYAVSYDELTVKKVKPKTNSKYDYTVQDEVKSHGEVIAKVCTNPDRQSVYFCDKETGEELPMYLLDSDFSTDDSTDYSFDYSTDEPTEEPSSNDLNY
jgi:hypothetical protein